MSKWISIKDELPNYDERVLVCLRFPNYPDDKIQLGRRVCHVSNGRENPMWVIEIFFADGEGELEEFPDKEITHWKRLSEPPAEE